MSQPIYISDLVSGTRTGGYVAISGTYTVLATDSVVNATSGTFTATLPTAVGLAGREYDIKNSGAGTITVACNGAQTIDGALTLDLISGESVSVVSDGANWIIL